MSLKIIKQFKGLRTKIVLAKDSKTNDYVVHSFSYVMYEPLTINFGSDQFGAWRYYKANEEYSRRTSQINKEIDAGMRNLENPFFDY